MSYVKRGGEGGGFRYLIKERGGKIEVEEAEDGDFTSIQRRFESAEDSCEAEAVSGLVQNPSASK